eukprot:Hpha_TRINITY_DN14943_c3_g10::TRINITY_DN14943_c3_g10_i1::g.143127::m.143127
MEERPRWVVPTQVLLAASTVVSTVVSLMGGMVLYFEGLSALEDTARNLALSESQVASERLGLYFVTVKEQAEQYEQIMLKAGQKDWSLNVTELRDYNMDLASALTRTNRRIVLGFGFDVVSGPNDSVEDYYQTFWWDEITEESLVARYGGTKMYVTATSGTHQSASCPDPASTHHCVRANIVNNNTDQVFGYAYDWSRRIWTYEEIMAKSGGWRMSAVLSWQSYDGTPYLYTQYWKFIPVMIPGHPSLGGGVVLQEMMMLNGWTQDLVALESKGSMFAISMTQGLQGDVFASSLNDLSVCSDRSALENYGCTIRLDVYHKWVALAAVHINNTAEGSFVRSTLDGGEYWLMRQVISKGNERDSYGRLDLVWTLATSTLEGRVIRSLMMFVGFIVAVVVFDVLTLFFELYKFAQPLRAMSRALVHLDSMNLEIIDAELGVIQRRHSVFAVSDVQKLLEAFSTAISALRVYRDFIPVYALPAALADEDEAEEDGTVVSPSERRPSSVASINSSAMASSHLNLSTRVTIRRGALAIINARQTLQEEDDEVMGRSISGLVTCLQYNLDKGSLDGGSGDHFWISWNGSRPATRSAWRAANSVRRVRDSSGLVVSCSVVGGCLKSVFVGDTGFRFMALLGPEVSFAFALERLAHTEGGEGSCVLCSDPVHCDNSCFIVFRWVTRCVYDKRGPTQVTVWELLHGRREEARTSEWMYEMEQMEDEWSLYNSAANKAILGDTQGALAVLEEGPRDGVHHVSLRTRIEAAQEEGRNALPIQSIVDVALHNLEDDAPDDELTACSVGTDDIFPRSPKRNAASPR